MSLGEVGSTGLNRWGGYVGEEFITQLQWPWAAKVYKEMADNDPTIGAVIYMSEQLIRKAGWTVEAVGETRADEEAKDFLESCMNDMSMSWSNVISEILSMFTYGWSWHETLYKIRRGPEESNPKYRSKYSDGRIGWRKMPIRSQHTLLQWVYDDEEDNLLAMEQLAPPLYKRAVIPLNKSLLFRTKISRDNPEGRSLLRNAYRPWYFKKRIEEIEGIGIERDLAGLPLLKPPENLDIWDADNPDSVRLLAQSTSLVKSVRRDQQEGLVIPFGWEFKLLSTGGIRQFNTNEIINRYDQRIAITVLADIVMLGADKVGSFALADVKKSLLAASLEAQIQNIAEVFNKYAVPRLFRYNYFPGIKDYPRIVPGEVEVPGLKDLGDFLRATGMSITDDLPLTNYLRQIASMPLKREKDFKAEQRRAKAAAAEQARLTQEALDAKSKDKKIDPGKEVDPDKEVV